ncbi:MAG: acetyl esterase/lipase [Spirosomataceae bacterium]|jgi:acetyl esterase/lipase
MRFPVLLFTLLTFSFFTLHAQREVVYKEINGKKLLLEIHSPQQLKDGVKYPAIVFFFGGGWNSGDRQHFIHHAKYFSQRGIVCFLADYRTKNNSQTTPFESVRDAKSAMRFIRKNAANFNVDPTKIITAGGSAGGHLAAATAFITDYNETTDDLNVSPIPNALVLYNPVIDNGPGGYGYERVGDAYKQFSPLHNIQKNAPPTIFFLGTQDALIPTETAEYYAKIMEKVGNRCDLKLYGGQIHGFFNYQNIEYYKMTVSATDKFLQSLGYLTENPKINID